MDVAIKHNGSTITGRVINYTREHRICTGIGTLDITLEGTYSTAIEPWDTIDITENGDFKVRYYVSEISRAVPSGNIILQCQDISKRLVDYFIPDSYTIDYPSYTRYWIEKFLDEAGLNYEFTVSSQGNLLSNYTAMGLQPAYDQIMMLLQLSGWYMYFDGNGKAIIGSLSIDLADTAGTLDKDDILDIKRISNDKMLRNRALVWGEFNPVTQRYAFADVTRHTRWNYDHRDIRTMVVSNHNIPDSASAYNIANILIKEFARITIEKHIVAWGARDFNLGDGVRVNSDVWRGKGLITTFGVSMDRAGLVTNIILDERCPRLFGFFDFGDYVYVGTYGDGVWRKHMKFDPNFYNFSSGLTDLAITDLHINNGIFGSVAASGGMFYTNTEAGPWHQIAPIQSLLSSEEDEVDSPSGVPISGMVPFSGISARAVIIDRETNYIKYGVDTRSGVNYGDYFMMYSGFITSSGTVNASGFPAAASGTDRGWIVEYDPFTGALIGDVGTGIFPIHYSGNYSMQVLDLENDGVNDYVSVRSQGEAIPNDGIGWNFGAQESQPFASTKETDTFSVTPENIQHVEDNEDGFVTFGHNVGYRHGLAIYDNELLGEMSLISVRKAQSGNPPTLRRRKLTRTITGDHTTSISSVTAISGNTGMPSGMQDGEGIANGVLGLKKIGLDNYRVFWYEGSAFGNNVVVKYQDWDADLNILGTATTILSYNGEVFGTVIWSRATKMCINDKAYIMWVYGTGGTGNSPSTQTYVQIHIITTDLDAATASGNHVMRFLFPLDEDSGTYFFVPTGQPTTSGASKGFDTQMTIGSGGIMIGLIQNGDSLPRVLGWFQGHHHVFDNGIGTPYRVSAREYILTGDVNTINVATLYDNQVVGDIAARYWNFSAQLPTNVLQLTADKGTITFTCSNASSPTTANACITFNGSSFAEFNDTAPDQLEYYKIYPILTEDGDYYVVKSGSNFYKADASALSLGSQISPPAGYTLIKPYSSPLHSLFGEVYFLCFNSNFDTVLVPFNDGSFSVSREIMMNTWNTESTRAINIGGFFVDEPTLWTSSDPIVTVNYMDMLDPHDDDTIYLVLQRDEMNYNLIRQAGKPIRVEISNNSPVLTVLDMESTFQSAFVYDSEVTVIIPTSGLDAQKEVRDYRYTMLEVQSGVIVGSGAEVGSTSQVLYVNQSGLYASDLNTYSGGFLQVDGIGSGIAERIETTNYTYPGQYIFITSSGENPDFYQRDAGETVFDYYSGLPDSRATIIRCDDRI